MRFSAVECDQCKKLVKWDSTSLLPMHWSQLTWYEDDGVEESVLFCSDACHRAFMASVGPENTSIPTFPEVRP